MKVLAASDSHVSHASIQGFELGRQIWPDVPSMNEGLIEIWNDTVAPDDVVFYLGDYAMGQIAESLPTALRLNGTKILCFGNHDRPFGMLPQTAESMHAPREIRQKSKNKHAKWVQKYLDAGFVIVTQEIEMVFEGTPIRLCHFPYEGDHDDDNVRYEHLYPVDDETLLIHGHMHSKWVSKLSSKGTPMVNVGADAREFKPVLLADLIAEGEALRAS